MGVDEEGVAHEMQDIVCQSRDMSAWVVRHHNSVMQASPTRSLHHTHSDTTLTIMHLKYKS